MLLLPIFHMYNTSILTNLYSSHVIKTCQEVWSYCLSRIFRHSFFHFLSIFLLLSQPLSSFTSLIILKFFYHLLICSTPLNFLNFNSSTPLPSHFFFYQSLTLPFSHLVFPISLSIFIMLMRLDCYYVSSALFHFILWLFVVKIDLFSFWRPI